MNTKKNITPIKAHALIDGQGNEYNISHLYLLSVFGLCVIWCMVSNGVYLVLTIMFTVLTFILKRHLNRGMDFEFYSRFCNLT